MIKSEKSAKNITTIVYALYAASFLVGITAIFAIVINYVKREVLSGHSWKAISAGR